MATSWNPRRKDTDTNLVSALRTRRGTTSVPITLHPAKITITAPTTAARARATAIVLSLPHKARTCVGIIDQFGEELDEASPRQVVRNRHNAGNSPVALGAIPLTRPPERRPDEGLAIRGHEMTAFSRFGSCRSCSRLRARRH